MAYLCLGMCLAMLQWGCQPSPRDRARSLIQEYLASKGDAKTAAKVEAELAAIGPEAVPPLMDRIAEETKQLDVFLLSTLASNLDSTGVKNGLIKLSKSSSEQTRVNVVNCIWPIDKNYKKKLLLELIADSSPQVRWNALGRSYGLAKEKSFHDRISAMLDDENVGVRIGAAGALASIGESRALDLLLSEAKSESHIARLLTAAVLASCPDPKAKAVLERLADDRDPEVAKAAKDSLIGWNSRDEFRIEAQKHHLQVDPSKGSSN